MEKRIDLMMKEALYYLALNLYFKLDFDGLRLNTLIPLGTNVTSKISKLSHAVIHSKIEIRKEYMNM